MSLWDHVARELGLQAHDVTEEASLGSGLHADAIIEAGDVRFVVESEGRPAREEDVGRIAMLRDVCERSSQGKSVRGVLAVPGAGGKVRAIAEAAGIRIVEVPTSIVPSSPEEVGKTPLTTQKSWAVVATLLRGEEFGSVRSLAEASRVSVGWTHRVVHELQARGTLRRSRGSLVLEDQEGVLDLVPTERPFKDLLSRTVETGIASPDEVSLSLTVGFNRIQDPGGKTGVYLAGTSAAAELTGYLVQGDRMDLYSEAPDSLAELFEGQSGGLELRVYEPDRDVTSSVDVLGGLPCVTEEQALLDVAGTGLAFRDLAHALLEVMKRG